MKTITDIVENKREVIKNNTTKNNQIKTVSIFCKNKH